MAFHRPLLNSVCTLIVLFIFVGGFTEARRRRYPSETTQTGRLKGANVCGSYRTLRCCPGWKASNSGRRCTKPVCSSGCGGGACMKPGMCLCPSREISPRCGSQSSGGLSSTCNPPCKNGGVCVARNLCRCPTGFSGGTCDNDLRVGPCYTQLSNNMCRGQLPGVSCTKHLCCSTIGMAWGDPCETCPASPHPCRRGYILNLVKNTCQDIDECQAIPGLCISGTCINTVGSYMCDCQAGQRQNIATGVCEDIDECLTQLDICGAGQCVNTEGSYYCVCQPGHELSADKSRCIAIRRKSCYTRILGDRCSDALSNPMSFTDCCCGTGKGWGDADTCQLCPLRDTDAFTKLCISPEPNTLCKYFGNICKNGRCMDTQGGSYRCDCYKGFKISDDGSECIDIDECVTQPDLCRNGECINLPGNYECKCNEGFVLAPGGRYCTDMNECDKTNMCPNGQCVNMDGTYKCQCNLGYKQSANQQVCIDIDECTQNGRLCIHGQCLNTPGSFRCVCNQGYRLSPDGAFCLDYNECQTTGMCTNGMCKNMDGSFKCICFPGYILAPSGEVCIDIDECSSQPGICVNGQCINNQGSFRCECPRSLTLGPDGRTCLDTKKDQCFMQYRRGRCSRPSRMLTTKSQCCCMVDQMESPGIAWGASCEPCPSMAEPLYKTLCPDGPGVDRNGGGINQCEIMPDACENGDCINLERGYRCSCYDGYRTDSTGKTCININECLENTRLCDGGRCRDSLGSYTCICPSGTTFDDYNKMCEDIDECLSSPCVAGTCLNTRGSFRCTCDRGFSLDSTQRICVDERKDLCWMNIRHGMCEDNVKEPMLLSECCNSIGKGWGSPCQSCDSVDKSPCRTGLIFSVDGCVDINECVRFPGQCKGGGTCVNTEGSFMCVCPDGMTLDSTGLTCIDTRKSSCYLDYRRGRCSMGLDGLYTRSKCCCTLGKAWSQQCEPCPSQGTDEFDALCQTGERIRDVNECTEFPDICKNGQCRNTIGSFTCVCDPGFALDARGVNCTDIDECRISAAICANGRCENTPGAFRCVCDDGFEAVMLDQMCMDIDECALQEVMCRGGKCVNTEGSYKCECPPGLELRVIDSGYKCVDIDECSSSSSICSNGYCENSLGGYQCRCNQGFQSSTDRTTCTDVNECADQNGGCQSICVNTPGSFTCGCEVGFLLQPDGRSCLDYNECKEDSEICNGGKCTNTPGGYRCTCTGGLRPSQDMKQCIDVDECYENSRLCENGVCVNTHGSYVCTCNNGFDTSVVDYRCTDIDECVTGQSLCDSNANCYNLPGSYRCECLPGFEGDGFTCRDVNECRREGMCATDAVCVNKDGSYACICNEGFAGDGFVCEDVDECTLDSRLCENGQCYNYPGSYRCVCAMGFAASEDEKECEDINECEVFSRLCYNGQCENQPGKFRCNCDRGFELDSTGGNCTDINECDNPENCLYGTCVNTEGAYNCICPTNYELNPTGSGCIDVRRGFCYFDVSQQRRTGRCDRIIGRDITRGKCCCSIGKGWGEDEGYCDQCPRNNTREYKNLCIAEDGFYPNTNTLLPEDIDECQAFPDICVNGQCKNTFGSFVCICPPGHRFYEERLECVDIDECAENPDYCGLGTCVNSIGNFSCLCPDGYMPMPGEGCMDMRKDVCYAALFNASRRGLPPRCEHQLATQVTKRQCCCIGNLGQGWGTPCEHCPVKNSREYLDLCRPLETRNETNECELYSFLCENGRCIDTNTEEGFLCECGRGFRYNRISKRCEDEDECRERRSPCQGNAVCINTVGSFRCECIQGYKLSPNGRRCIDNNECEEISGICANGECVNLDGGFSCRCKAGFRLSSSRDSCLDVDECQLQPGLCRNGTCENRVGGYECNCSPGFRLSANEDCEDIDECRDFYGICMNAQCRNTPGSFVCECLPGYTSSLDRMNCRDLDECSEIEGICRNGMCRNTDGSYQCTCFEGYRLSSRGDSCEDFNECRSIPDLCANGQCINEEGGFRCICPSGYILSEDGRRCLDLRQGSCYREFTRGVCRNPRPMNMTRLQCCCTSGAAWSYIGSQLCEVCPVQGEDAYDELCDGRENGPSGDKDLNECMLEPLLCKNGRCINTDGSFRCECNPGYVLNTYGQECIDIDECQVQGACGNGTCDNSAGGFSCTCDEGFLPGPNEICEDINECEGPLNQCAFRCTNLYGSYTCVCPMGYQLAEDGIHCEDVNECDTPVNNCRYNCKNLIGTFMCVCPEGYRETGRDQCADIDECREQPDICGPGQCRNTMGGYRCHCPYGYRTSQDGKQCLDYREDYCYSNLISGRCIPTRETPRSTQTACCCTIGAAWGRRCEICPTQGTNAYRIMCPLGPGYDPDGTDINECEKYSDICVNGRCLNTMGSYRCVCDPGYKTDALTGQCVDKNECEDGTASCDHNCLNTVGSYRCTCRQGYVLNMDGKSCRDIDECATGQHNCPHDCTNTDGGFECGCPPGYTQGRNKQCVDIDECQEESSLCTPGGQCRNTPGNFTCVCNQGYKLDSSGRRCIDIDECEDGLCETMCENSAGGFYCGCPEGFEEYWNECYEIDVCTSTPCLYECMPVGQEFMCGCPPGYQMIGEGHCIQTISPADYSSMFPPGVALPHEQTPGAGELPPGEGCYSCNIGDVPLEAPVSRRNKRSLTSSGTNSIVKTGDFIEWLRLNDDDDDDDDNVDDDDDIEETGDYESYKDLLKASGDIVLEDIHSRPHRFRPRIVKRDTQRRKSNQLKRHPSKSKKATRAALEPNLDLLLPVPVFLNLTDVSRKTKLIKILPALASLQGNVEYKITNRDDKLFFLREKKGINSLHARRKKLLEGMTYHVDIEAKPLHQEINTYGEKHVGESMFQFFIYVL